MTVKRESVELDSLFLYNVFMKRRGWITVGVILIVWMIGGILVDNSIKLPSLFDVLIRMKELMFSSVLYESFGYTLMRSLSGLVFALGCGIVLGLCSGINHKFEEYFYPIYLVLKSIPNISYILIVLIWSSNSFTMRVISFMVMFPVAYENVLKGIKSIDPEYLDVLKIYPQSLFDSIFRVYLPLISNYILASLSVGIGLTFKVGIMAEILGSVSPGVGRQFQLCRINVDMIGTFAWTLWLIILLVFLELLVSFLKRRWMNR